MRMTSALANTKGEPHLCVTVVNQQLGYGVGYARMSDRPTAW